MNLMLVLASCLITVVELSGEALNNDVLDRGKPSLLTARTGFYFCYHADFGIITNPFLTFIIISLLRVLIRANEHLSR